MKNSRHLLFTYDGKPIDIDTELQRLAMDALKSEDLASFAINDILPSAGRGDAASTLDMIWTSYNDTKMAANCLRRRCEKVNDQRRQNR